jgi:hypothetical protein
MPVLCRPRRLHATSVNHFAAHNAAQGATARTAATVRATIAGLLKNFDGFAPAARIRPFLLAK